MLDGNQSGNRRALPRPPRPFMVIDLLRSGLDPAALSPSRARCSDSARLALPPRFRMLSGKRLRPRLVPPGDQYLGHRRITSQRTGAAAQRLEIFHRPCPRRRARAWLRTACPLEDRGWTVKITSSSNGDEHEKLLVRAVLTIVAATSGVAIAEAAAPDPVIGTWQLNVSSPRSRPARRSRVR